MTFAVSGDIIVAGSNMSVLIATACAAARSTPEHVVGDGVYHSGAMVIVSIVIGVELTVVFVSTFGASTPEAVPLGPSLRTLMRDWLVACARRSHALTMASTAAAAITFLFMGSPRCNGYDALPHHAGGGIN